MLRHFSHLLDRMATLVKPDHVGPHVARQSMANLLEASGDRPGNALRDLASWIVWARPQPGLSAAKLCELLDEVEQHAQSAEHVLLEKIVSQSDSEPALFSAWSALLAYRQELSDAYLDVHTRWTSKPFTPARALSAARVGARALRCMQGLLGLHLLRMRSPEQAFWSTAYAVYRSSTDRYRSIPVELSADGARPTTIAKEFGKLVLLHGAGCVNLRPLLVQTLLALLQRHGGAINFSPHPTAEAVFYVDTNSSNVPLPIGATADPAASGVFVGPGTLLDIVQGKLARGEALQVPAFEHTPRPIPRDDLSALLRHLRRVWSPVPPERETARIGLDERVEIAYGLDALWQHFAPPSGMWSATTGLALQDAAVFEAGRCGRASAALRDVSTSGAGFRLERGALKWAAAGQLWAFRPRSDRDWHIGVLQRLLTSKGDGSAGGGGEVYAGIKTLDAKPVAVVIRRVASTTSPWDFEREFDQFAHEFNIGLLFTLPRRGVNSAQLIVRRGTYALGERIEILIETRTRGCRVVSSTDTFLDCEALDLVGEEAMQELATA